MASIVSWSPSTKSDIIAFAVGNPINKIHARLSQNNEFWIGESAADTFIRRHNRELQRCSQYYSLASLYNESLTKDKHSKMRKNLRKIYPSVRKSFLKLFSCVLS